MARFRRGRITTPDWTAEFVTDGRVRKCHAQLDFMKGFTDDEVRSYAKSKGWKLTRVLTDIEKAERDPLVASILGAFPGAEVVSVRDPGPQWGGSDRMIETLDALFEHEDAAHEGVEV